MNISRYSSLAALILILLACVLSTALGYGWHQLKLSEANQHQHDRLQQRLTSTLQGALRDYLASGDPVRLASAEGARRQAINQLDHLDSPQTTPLRAELELRARR